MILSPATNGDTSSSISIQVVSAILDPVPRNDSFQSTLANTNAKSQDQRKCYGILPGGCYSELVTGVVVVGELVEGRSQVSFSW